jgi:hypothetical protein
MEVVCGGECFTPAGIPCRRDLWTLGVEKSLKKDKNQTIALAVGMNVEAQSNMGSRDPALITTGRGSTYEMVYCRCSSNMSGYQLFDH